jgi:hypothetical protein
MKYDILAVGPPALTELAADAAIDTIDFIAAAVRGYDAIDVTDIVRPLWRLHLVNWYPHLPPPTRAWFANAPQILAAIQTQWPLLNPFQRGMQLQQWSMELPQMLAMIDPVLAQAQAMQMQQQQRAHLEQLRQQAGQVAPAGRYTAAGAINEIGRRADQAQNLMDFSTRMTTATSGLIRAMSRR